MNTPDSPYLKEPLPAKEPEAMTIGEAMAATVKTGENIHSIVQRDVIEKMALEDLPEALRESRKAMDDAEKAWNVASAKLEEKRGRLNELSLMEAERNVKAADLKFALSLIKEFAANEALVLGKLENWPEKIRRGEQQDIGVLIVHLLREAKFHEFLNGWVKRAQDQLTLCETIIRGFKKTHSL